MTTKPILFSTEMVRAILEGRKTQTRRIKKSDKPKYQKGDVLWVRETWAKIYDPIYKQKIGYIYKCGHNKNNDVYDFKWKPSIHMPKEACRLFLEVVDVRLERLQDITEEDAIGEGIEIVDTNLGKGYKFYLERPPINAKVVVKKPKESFMSLWDSINGKKIGFAWKDNPEVWVYDFKVIDKPKEF